MEDCGSRHGTFVNGKRIKRQALCNSDRIEFGAQDSYQLVFALDGAELKRLMEQVGAAEKSQPPGVGGNLAKLRAILDLARTLQSSFSVDDVLVSVVDTALAITGAERGFLMLRVGRGLGDPGGPAPATGTTCTTSDLRVPREVLHRALQHRRELLSMNFDPLGGRRNAAAEQHRRPGTAQRHLRAPGAHPHRTGRGDQRALHRQRNGGRAVHGFAPGRGGPGGRQPGTAADPGDRSLHGAGKRAPAGGRAGQAADGGGTAPGAHHPAEPAAWQAAGGRLAASLRQQRGVARGGRRLFRCDARQFGLLDGGGGGRFGEGREFGAAGVAAAGSADHRHGPSGGAAAPDGAVESLPAGHEPAERNTLPFSTACCVWTGVCIM